MTTTSRGIPSMPTTTKPSGRPLGPAQVFRLRVCAMVCAILLALAPVLPPSARLIVLPALLFGPGWTLAYCLDMTRSWSRSVSAVAPLSLAITILISLVLDAIDVRLSSATLGLPLGVVTAVFLLAGMRRPSDDISSGAVAADTADGGRRGHSDGEGQPGRHRGEAPSS